MHAARARGIQVYYPFLSAAGPTVRTGFRRVDAVTELALGGSGFAEPREGAPDARRGDIDLMVVPALAVDAGRAIGSDMAKVFTMRRCLTFALRPARSRWRSPFSC